MPQKDNRHCISAAVCVLAASFTVLPALANAPDVEARKALLLECAERQIEVERTREHPSAKRVLDACVSEARAFEALLPADLAEGARRHLEHLIQHRLE